MGDKSPKAKQKNNKQHAVEKNRQRAAIAAKTPVSAPPKAR